MKNKIVFLFLFLSFILQIIILIKPIKNKSLSSENSFDYQSLTNLVNILVDTRLPYSAQVTSTNSISSNDSNSQLIARTYSRNYSCSFVGGRPALQFSGSSAVYFTGDFCAYGKLLTITPNRCLLKQGIDLAVIYNDCINIDLIPDDVSKGNNNQSSSSNTFPQPFNFFDNK